MTAPSRRPGMLWASLAMLAVVAAMAAVVAADPSHPFTQGMDDAWRRLVGVGPDSAVYTGIVPMFFQYLGEGLGFALTVVVLPVAAGVCGRWRTALFLLASALFGPVLLAQIAKNLVDRPRPAPDAAAGLSGPLFHVDHGSFPSGHAATCAALVVALAAVIPASRTAWRRIWWAVGVLLMAGMVWQRTLVNAHWLSDTLFGLLIGAAGTLLMGWALWPWLRADDGRPFWFLHRAERAALVEENGRPAAPGAPRNRSIGRFGGTHRADPPLRHPRSTTTPEGHDRDNL